jgi:ribosomal protein S18 acetylase RimI-like enzyme
VDLFVRVSNEVAVNMYKRLGYVVYRRVLDYYSGDPDEDAFGKNSLKLVVIFFKLKKVILIYHT